MRLLANVGKYIFNSYEISHYPLILKEVTRKKADYGNNHFKETW